MTDVITALGLILGVLIAYLQVQKNHRAELLLQESHLRNELKLKLYDRVGSIMANAGGKLSKATVQYYSVISALDMRVRKGFAVAPTNTGLQLSDQTHEAQQALSGVLRVLEEYEILFLRFGSFRRAFSAGHSRLLETHQALWSKVLPFLPFIHSETGKQIGPMLYPAHEELTEIENLNRVYVAVCNDLSGYLIDLEIETQNELLGDLFKRQLPPRHPADRSIVVLRRDDSDLAERPEGSLI